MDAACKSYKECSVNENKQEQDMICGHFANNRSYIVLPNMCEMLKINCEEKTCKSSVCKSNLKTDKYVLLELKGSELRDPP